MREGHIKARGTPNRPLAPCRGSGALPANLAETQRPRLALEGVSANKPLLPNEKVARGSYKKPGELLTALLLRAEATELFVQICRGPFGHEPGSRGLGISAERDS